MSFMRTCVISCVAIFGLLTVFCQDQKLQMVIKTISIPENVHRSPFEFQNLSYSMQLETGNFLVSGVLKIKMNMLHIYLNLEILRCYTEDSNSCNLYMSFKTRNLCDDFGKKGMVLSPVFDNLKDFPKQCPVPKGSYELSNCYLDVDKIRETFQLPEGYWYFQPTLVLRPFMYITGAVKPARIRMARKENNKKKNNGNA